MTVHIRTPAEVAAEVARVLAALPPVGAAPARADWIATDAGLDADTCMRRIGQLAAQGEAWVHLEHGVLVVRCAEPPKRADVADAVRSRFVPEPFDVIDPFDNLHRQLWAKATPEQREDADEAAEAWLSGKAVTFSECCGIVEARKERLNRKAQPPPTEPPKGDAWEP